GALWLGLPSRPHPPLPLARPRARARLAELRDGPLRVTADESTPRLPQVGGLGLPGDSSDGRGARREGMAGGSARAARGRRGRGRSGLWRGSRAATGPWWTTWPAG